MQHEAALPEGVRHYPGRLNREEQRDLLAQLRGAIAVAPLYRAEMPKTGHPMSVQMTNLGPLGWYTDKESGYRYIEAHPATGNPWPPIPATLLRLWSELARYP